MDDKPHPNDPPININNMKSNSAAPASQEGAELSTVASDDRVSNEKKRKRQDVSSSDEQKQESLQPRSIPGPVLLPNAEILPASNNGLKTLFGTPSNQQIVADSGQGVLQQMQAQFASAANTALPSFGDSQNSPLQLQHQQQFQQQGYSIFGLSPMQLQQMLLMQMQMSQVPGSQNGVPFNQVSQLGVLGQQGSLSSSQQQMMNSGFLGTSQSLGGPPSNGSPLQYIQPAGSGTSGQSISSPSSGRPPSPVSRSRQSSADGGGAPATKDSRLSGRSPIVLYMSCDEESLSEYQCLVRKNIELFEATQLDVDSNAQGRNKAIVLGQVGIRCRHCTMLPPKHRSRGAMYYPAKLNGLYQAAQNQANGHLAQHCNHIPPNIRSELVRLKDMKSSAGGGKKYWADGVKVLGIYEDSNGLRFEKRS